MDKLPDEEAACNLIKHSLRYIRANIIAKTIRIMLYDLEGFTLSSRLTTTYNIKTNNVSFSHGIRWKRCLIYPTTNKKLKCTNQHALDKLAATRLSKHKTRRFEFADSFGRYTAHSEIIIYNPNTGNISFVHRFAGTNGHTLPIIDI